MKYDRALFVDMITVSAQILGIVLSLILFTTQGSFLLVFSEASAGILLDVLQFAYMRLPPYRVNRWFLCSGSIIGSLRPTECKYSPF